MKAEFDDIQGRLSSGPQRNFGGQDRTGRWLYALEQASLAGSNAAESIPTRDSASGPKEERSTSGTGERRKSQPQAELGPVGITESRVPVTAAGSASTVGLTSAFLLKGSTSIPAFLADASMPMPVPPRDTRGAGNGQARAVLASDAFERSQSAEDGTQAYARQNLHVYTDGENLQVWVRDAALTADGARILRQRMLDEAIRSGNRAVSITVNGDTGDRPGPTASLVDAPAPPAAPGVKSF